jgi:hypothetical protein
VVWAGEIALRAEDLVDHPLAGDAAELALREEMGRPQAEQKAASRRIMAYSEEISLQTHPVS